MNSLTKTQWILIASAVLLVVALFSLDLKTPGTEKAGGGKQEANAAPTELNQEKIKQNALESVPVEVKNNILVLEKKVDGSKGAERTKAVTELAGIYSAYKQFSLAGLYYFEEGKQNKSAALYTKAGDAFRDAYRNSTDSNMTPVFVAKAKESYQTAMDLEPSNLDAKTGMGTCYVDASENPMQGIQLLLEVVKEEPENVNANLNLGMFSMRSGQHEKAISRFQTVVKKQPSAENYAMLAEAFEQTGDKKAAVEALKKAKEYVIDPQVAENIDAYIKTLEK